MRTGTRGLSPSVLELSFATSGLASSRWTVACETNCDQFPVIFKIVCTAKIPSYRVHSFVDVTKFSQLCNAISVFYLWSTGAKSVITAIKNYILREKCTVFSVYSNSCSPRWNEKCSCDVEKPLGSSFSGIRVPLAGLFQNLTPQILCELYHVQRKHSILADLRALSQPNRRQALFSITKFTKSRCLSPNAPCLVRTPEKIVEFLKNIACDVQTRSATRIPSTSCRNVGTADFEEAN